MAYELQQAIQLIRNSKFHFRIAWNTSKKLGKEVIRKEYQEQLVNGKLSEVGGAGLGFIDIARKSGKQMEYCFSPKDDERLFFTFNVKVS